MSTSGRLHTSERDEARSEVEGLATRVAHEPPEPGELGEHRVAGGFVDAEVAGDVGERSALGRDGREELHRVDEPFGLR